jgi:hypothetical protein
VKNEPAGGKVRNDKGLLCIALDLNRLRNFGSCAIVRANGALSGQQDAHRPIPNRQSAHRWAFPMSKCGARSAHMGKAQLGVRLGDCGCGEAEVLSPPCGWGTGAKAIHGLAPVAIVLRPFGAWEIPTLLAARWGKST